MNTQDPLSFIRLLKFAPSLSVCLSLYLKFYAPLPEAARRMKNPTKPSTNAPVAFPTPLHIAAAPPPAPTASATPPSQKAGSGR